MNTTKFLEAKELLPAAKKYIYMNSAGCGPLPVPVVRAMNATIERMMEEGQVNVQVHDDLIRLLDDIRADVARFIGAQPEEIYFVRCIAEGLNGIARMIPLQSGDEVLVTDQENPAGFLPYFVMEPTHTVHTRHFHAVGSKEEILSAYEAALTPSTRLVSVSHVLHTTGACLPVKEMCDIARKRGILTALDGAQAMGNVKVDVSEIGCDFYALSCHKWLCGFEGIAAVYIRSGLIDSLIIPYGGVGMQKSFQFCEGSIEPKAGAKRFEFGGRHTAMYTAFSETIAFCESLGLADCIARRAELFAYCLERLASLDRLTVISAADKSMQTGIFSFFIEGADHQTLVKEAFAEDKLIIQWRTIDLFTGKQGIRVSLNWFNTEEEIDVLYEFLKRKIAAMTDG